ncbi:MAG: UPF0753 protein [Betaproteobacteria bacterium]|nr:MAG: UPF0753 protein [Betaproteobacteria bacterium]
MIALPRTPVDTIESSRFPRRATRPEAGVASAGVARPASDADGSLHERVDAACERACRTIAPAWPLDRAIAVNPHWGRIGRPVREVAARLAVLGDIRVFPPRSELRTAWREGRIGEDDLARALDALPAARDAGLTPAACVDALRAPPSIPSLPLLIDVLDDDPAREARLHWRHAITHQVSQTCAAYFDERQADWQPDRRHGLYAFWRATLTHDHGIGVLMGLPDLGTRLHALPDTRRDAECWVLQRLGLPEAVWPEYLEAVLLTVHGWASWCAYLGWQARLAGGHDGHLRDLLAIRLAWGAILLECKDDASARHAFATVQAAWRRAPDVLRHAAALLLVDEVWQLALETGYQRRLVRKLALPAAALRTARTPDEVEVQAAFCIDVRSEPMRRALEAASPALRTLGFAGFFGMPVAYVPLATTAHRPQLPGLLAPAAEAVDRIEPGTFGLDDGRADPTASAAQARRQRFALWDAWTAANRWPGTAFAFVEAAGAAYLGKLAAWLHPSAAPRARDDLAGLPSRHRDQCRPALAGLDTSARVALAARVLHAMGLDRQLAPLVLLVGHGSQSANNAHAAALDCGACCGQTGEVNARVLARLLNAPEVRDGLRAGGIAIPAPTAFVAALHNTTTDEIEGFDLDLLPPDARARWERLQPVFARAGDRVRRERAARLRLDPEAGRDRLLAAVRRRANDGAQTRPEWGLAGNAAFVIAPRHRTRGVSLDGRCFLHDYDATSDRDGSVLELLMTAPMVVTHWINWQYHASTCDPTRLGSGNKLLHNVVGGDIGVFEGNGGDLRIGLSRQSLHDGERWVHEPLRLTVIVDAPRDAIERVIRRHPTVAQLVDNGWLHLWRFDGPRLERRVLGCWRDVAREDGDRQAGRDEAARC